MTDTMRFSGRARKPLLSKINPAWWVLNDDNQTVDQAPWYMPAWPHWLRSLFWNVFRNPLQNFRSFVVGVQDKNYTVVGRYPIVNQRDDLPGEWGFQWSVNYGGDLWVPRLFFSFSSSLLVVQFGTQPIGFATFKLNKIIGYAIMAAMVAAPIWWMVYGK